MRSIKSALILTVAFVIGSAVATQLPAQGMIDGYHSLTPDQINSVDDFRRVFNSHVRIRAYNNGSMAWMGSGTAISRQNGRITILTNWHVAGKADRVTVEYFIDGFSQGETESEVEFLYHENQLDIGVVTTADLKSLAKVETIPMVATEVEVGQQMFWVGSARGEWPQGRLGNIVNVSNQFFLCTPKSIGGDSGSSMVQFLDDGTPQLIGLTAWVTTFEGRQVAMSMKASEVLEALKLYEPKVPGEDIPEIELSPAERDGLFQNLLERLKRDRIERQLEIKSIRDMLRESIEQRKTLQTQLNRLKTDMAEKIEDCEDNCTQGDLQNLELSLEQHNELMQLEEEQQEEARLFKGRIFEWLAALGQGMGEVEDSQESLGSKLNDSFASVKVIVGFMKIMFWSLIALLVASLFFKQGWATTVIVTFVAFFFRTGKLAYLLVHNAISKKNDNPKTLSEALEDLQDGISVGIGTSEDEK